ncbi:MAG: TraX family protein [Bacillota bacterium]|nr:TraX family protein [Bacillota bacterium]
MNTSFLFSLNTIQLKWIACFFMLLDHIGALLFPQEIIFRMLGRVTFPIFAFMTANACIHTKNIRRYLLRLAIFSLAYEPVFHYCMGGKINIFATIFLGALAIHLYTLLLKNSSLKFLAFLPLALFCIAAELLPIQYGAYGIVLIFFFYIFSGRPAGLVLSSLCCCFLYLYLNWPSTLQFYSLLAVPLILLYNGKRGKGSKWIFYIFYCLHIPLLYLIALLL